MLSIVAKHHNDESVITLVLIINTYDKYKVIYDILLSTMTQFMSAHY